jgi:hypothetical protein
VRRLHRSKQALAAAGAFAWVAVGCGKSPPVTTRTVTLHTPKACAVGGGAYVQYFELGDFEATAPSSGHLAKETGQQLAEIDQAARALVVEATQSDRTWDGVAPLASTGDVDVLLLPARSACPLSPSVRLPSRPGAVVAPLAGDLALVVGGSSQKSPHPSTFVANLATGAFASLTGPPDLGGLRTAASLTAFGSGALVAGGVDANTGETLATAETFAPGAGFDQHHPISLSEPRADHGAVVLAGGQTLLVGGVRADGKTVLGTMDRVDPSTGTAQEQGVAVLAVPRRSPQVLRLASGEILVAGGLDGAGNAVATVEWFSADAKSATGAARDLVTGSARSFVALGAGGALAVVAPPAGAPPTFPNVWVIDADGVFEAAAPLPDVTNPILFAGAGGAPLLWTGTPGGRWLRWQPWQGTFAPLGVLDATPADVSTSNASADPGLALWLDGTTSALTALRFDTRGPYSTLVGPLLSSTTSDVAPDRLAATGTATFDPTAGLTLGPGASAFVTDRTYAGVTVSVDAPTAAPAMVVLRDELGVELEVGGTACPGALGKGGVPSTIHVSRAGAVVSWSSSALTMAQGTAAMAASTGTCATTVRPDARLSIGVRAPAGATASVVRNLTVTRARPTGP